MTTVSPTRSRDCAPTNGPASSPTRPPAIRICRAPAEILKALDRAGADVLEVGVPFSDPLADGPVIQRATERALAAGGSLRTALALIAEVRPQISAPIVIFSYANPLLRMGLDTFARQAADAGVDGVLALDLPIEEAGELPRDARGGRHRYDLPSEPDDDRRADSEGGRARAAGFCTGFRGSA